ncbi:uncharacterized protein LOC142644301 [Castanea sativa]|uniref:uncharacterized protein LOC142644301 n=1 Tax=Castanea sativa TaxID=21020 RepID=UPI003F649439
MAVHLNNEALMCKIFPFSLGLVAMRWFDALEEGSLGSLEEGPLGSFEELTRAFRARFIMCSRVPKPLDSLLSMAMREGETLKTYSDRYWETYNEIDDDIEDVAMRTFKVGLPTKHGLRKSLVMKAALNMRQLMDCIDKYKRVEEDQIQGKGKTKMFLERKDPRGVGYQGNHLRREPSGHPSPMGTPLINSLFKELVYQILEKIQNEPYFRWPNKMSGDASLRNQSLHCHYHQDKGHTIEECRMLRDHLNQVARAGKLNHFLCQPRGQFGDGSHHGNIPRPGLGTINVILAKPGGERGTSSKIMSMRGGLGDEVTELGNQIAKRAKLSAVPILGFSEEDKEGTCQPHVDALVVTIRIGEYDVKRVLVDDGSGVEIMYSDLFNGLNLKVEDLEKYDSPLVGFNGKSVIPQGMIRLPVQVEDEEVQVNFIVVKAYSPYTTILARPWLHAMGAVSSTLHVKVKYPTRGWVGVLLGSQSMAR